MKKTKRLATLFLIAVFSVCLAVATVPAVAEQDVLTDLTGEFTAEQGGRPQAVVFESDTFMKTDGLVTSEPLAGAYTIEFDAATTADGSAQLGGTPFMITFGNASATENIGGDAQINKDDCVTVVATVGGIHTGRNDYTASGHKIWDDPDCTQPSNYSAFTTKLGVYFSYDEYLRFRFDVTEEGTIDIYAGLLSSGSDPVYMNTVGLAEGDTTTATTDGYFSLLSGTTGALRVMNFKINGEAANFDGEDTGLLLVGENHSFREENYFYDNTRIASEFYLDPSKVTEEDTLFDVTYSFYVAGEHGAAQGGYLTVSLLFGMEGRNVSAVESSGFCSRWNYLAEVRDEGEILPEKIDSPIYLVSGAVASIRLVAKAGGTLDVYAAANTWDVPAALTKTYTGLSFEGYVALEVSDTPSHPDSQSTLIRNFTAKVNSAAVTYLPYGAQFGQEEVKVSIGSTVTPACTVIPEKASDKTLVFRSEDAQIASVDASSGAITGVSRGTTNVVATTVNGKTASIRVVVTQPVTGVSLDKESLELSPGESYQLTATVEPETAEQRGVVFSVSDPAVLKVNVDGKVTALSGGTATVTVTTEDGGFTAECSVYVPEPVKGVTLDVIWAELKVGEVIKISATVNPAAATERGVTYSSSDETVATVSQTGEIVALKEGTAVITVTTADGGYTDECIVEVVVPEQEPETGCSGTAALPAGGTVLLLAVATAVLVRKTGKHER